MTTWRVGMKAVCVDDCWHDHIDKLGDNCPLTQGKTYTVSAIVSSPGVYRGVRRGLSLRLAELVNEESRCRGFDPARFRPAVSRPTDISIFKALLRDPHQHITEDA